MKHKITFNSPVVSAFVIISFGAMVSNYLTMGVSIGNMMYMLLLGPMLEEKY